MEINKEWYESTIKDLKQKIDFLEQQKSIFRENGFNEFANEIAKEIEFLKSDVDDLSYELTLKKIKELKEIK
jgi:hypothetical protein